MKRNDTKRKVDGTKFLKNALDKAVWIEPNLYPVNMCIVNGVPYEQSLLRQALKDYYYHYTTEEEQRAAIIGSCGSIRMGTIDAYIESRSGGMKHWSGILIKNCLGCCMDDVIIDGFWHKQDHLIEYFYNFALNRQLCNTTDLCITLHASGLLS